MTVYKISWLRQVGAGLAFLIMIYATRPQKSMILEGEKCGLPILGICHGLNVINIINGGKIEQDITVFKALEKVDHDVFPLNGDLAHDITIKTDTHLHDILSGNDIKNKQ
jgi:putative glutamine amidotransferase